jgi:hypothetical protein
MVFARPATILLLWPLADRPWVTPNRITAVGFVLRLLGAGLLYWATGAGALWGAVALLNLGLVLDNMDGTLARYRRCGTSIGYYTDKVLDQVAYLLLFAAVGARTYRSTGRAVDLALPLVAYSGICIAGYCKWVAEKVLSDLRLRQQLASGTLEAYVSQQLRVDGGQPPPRRTPWQWVQWLGRAFRSLIYFNEIDVSMWLTLSLAMGRPTFFTRSVAAMYALAPVIVPVYFFRRIVAAEAQRAGPNPQTP